MTAKPWTLAIGLCLLLGTLVAISPASSAIPGSCIQRPPGVSSGNLVCWSNTPGPGTTTCLWVMVDPPVPGAYYVTTKCVPAQLCPESICALIIGQEIETPLLSKILP
ncbi:MAG TPA: hypothetical protein VNZ52_06680 [Candidatus Thermoplasmatota archaeon]|nr:hypothetical protein [Candidatus Thermoplasmatota archaeon]